jgi:hypothetical protein
MDGDDPLGKEIRWKQFSVGGKHKKQNRRKRTVKRLLLAVTSLLILLVLAGAYFTHGFLWSIYTPIYDRVLHSIPAPPALLMETDGTDLQPEHPCGRRGYKANLDHAEAVDFFIAQLPRVGWSLVEHKMWEIDRKDKPGEYMASDTMLFANHQRYWLVVRIRTAIDAEGVRVDNPEITLSVCRDKDL